MTDPPEDLPSPDEFRRKMAHVDREFADARRYLSALCAEDNQALGALMVEIHRSGRAMNVLAAMSRSGSTSRRWPRTPPRPSGTRPSSAARDNLRDRT